MGTQRVLFVVCAVTLFQYGLTCGNTPAPTEGDTTAATTQADTTAASTEAPTTTAKSCSDDLELQEYNAETDSGYGEGGPVETGEELAFDAADTAKGCWKNHDSPADELDFVKAEDGAKLSECENGDAPSGPVIVHYSPEGSGEDSALFHSCSVLCSKGPPKVTAEGGSSPDVKMEVCRAGSFVDVELVDCTPLEWGKEVEVGSEERPTIYDIVIKASGFTANSFAAIQKITVAYEPCPAKSSVCKAKCDFKEQSTCEWKKDDSTQAASEFKPYEKDTTVGNLDSGVNALLPGGAEPPKVSDAEFLAVPLNPNDKVVAVTELDSATTEDVDMKFERYEACADNSVKVCTNSPDDCIWNSDEGVEVADREWVPETVTIPAGTEKLYLVAENTGSRFCAGGFQKLQFVKTGTEESACGDEDETADDDA